MQEILVIPSMTKVAMGIGGSHGRGADGDTLHLYYGAAGARIALGTEHPAASRASRLDRYGRP
jgi:hypothetical protein